MSRSATINSEQPIARGELTTRVSLYDRVFGSLLALILLAVFLLTVLFTIWWFQGPLVQGPGHRTILDPNEPEQVVEKEELNIVEFEDSEGQAFEATIEMSGASIARLSQLKPSQLDGGGSGGTGFGDDGGHGIGIERHPQPAGGPATPKWSVVQQAEDLESYQRKLDFFAIEIGAVHKSRDQIWRIAQLATEKIVTESSRSAESVPRYFVNQRKRLQQWDRQTIADAGIDLQDVIAVHFYPNDLIVKMQQLIDARCGDRSKDLAAVTFEIVGNPDDYRFEVVSLDFHNEQ